MRNIMKNNASNLNEPAGKRTAPDEDRLPGAGKPAPMSRLYSEKQACYILGIELKTLLEAVSAGELKFVRIGNEMRFNSAELERLMAKRKIELDESGMTISPTTEGLGSC